jgi:hypothetical protein
VQLQYVFLTITVHALFSLSNFIASTNFSFIRWMRKNHAEVLITSSSDSRPRPIDLLVPESTDFIATLRGFSFPTNTASLNRNYLFFKYLFNLSPYTSVTSSFSKIERALNESLAVRSKVDFGLESLIADRSISVEHLDSINLNFSSASVISQLTLNTLKFNRVAR